MKVKAIMIQKQIKNVSFLRDQAINRIDYNRHIYDIGTNNGQYIKQEGIDVTPIMMDNLHLDDSEERKIEQEKFAAYEKRQKEELQQWLQVRSDKLKILNNIDGGEAMLQKVERIINEKKRQDRVKEQVRIDKKRERLQREMDSMKYPFVKEEEENRMHDDRPTPVFYKNVSYQDEIDQLNLCLDMALSLLRYLKYLESRMIEQLDFENQMSDECQQNPTLDYPHLEEYIKRKRLDSRRLTDRMHKNPIQIVEQIKPFQRRKNVRMRHIKQEPM
eukprot:CAMPEP_0117422598 /NCGR_PEP_ID=MMETSP0758-20121206/3407_1 /TAXON_ID=63605 /ORGANISM="Percolomonas cosmopolitus, Strain AE-1 (ATCC 50343)" /LENGTH=273 /DNA_ID=CAMNT_0005205317 /DNA_START=70 /DNA_END=891 /DNA_ORIENTATION=-